VAEFEYGLMDGKTKSILVLFIFQAYRQRFNTSDISITLNSKAKVSSSFNLLGFAHQLKLCASANYLKDSYKFGYGITMG
jgi:mitochondrial import receptor subunit TOM40